MENGDWTGGEINLFLYKPWRYTGEWNYSPTHF